MMRVAVIFNAFKKNVTGPSVSHHATWVQEVKQLKPHNSSFAHTGRDGGVIVTSSRLILKGFLQWLAPSLHSKKVHGLFWMGVVCYLHVRALRLPPAVCGALQRAGGVPESSWVQFQDPLEPRRGTMATGDGLIQLKGSSLLETVVSTCLGNTLTCQILYPNPDPFVLLMMNSWSF